MTSKEKPFSQVVKEQKEEIEQQFVVLRKLYPGVFNKDGSLKVASATFPKVGEWNEDRKDS